MKKRYRMLSALLAFSLLAGMTGCSSDGSPSSGQPRESSGPAGTAKESSSSAAPGDEEPVTIKVGYDIGPSATFYGGETLEKNAWSELYAENGIELEILFAVDSSSYSEKLAQSIMAGNYPDVFRTNAAGLRDYVEQGVVREVGSLLEEYGSEKLKAFYSSEIGEASLKASMIDGSLYSLPSAGDPASASDILWVRKDWLDNLGLQPPKTAAEFYEVARAFTENDPDGDGQNNTYGFTFAGASPAGNTVFGRIGPLFGMFGTYLAFGGDLTFVEKDGKAVFGGADVEAMKKGLRLLQQMYADGYIEKSFITAGLDQIHESAAAGKVGMVIGTHYTIGNDWANGLFQYPEMEWIGVLMPGETGEQRGTMIYNAKPGGEAFNCLSSQCENPKAFITMMNLAMDHLATPEDMTVGDFAKYHGDGANYTGFPLAPIRAMQPMKNYYSWIALQKALDSGDTSRLNAEQMVYYDNMTFYLAHTEDYASLQDEDLARFKTGLYNYSMWGMQECANKIIDDAFSAGNMLPNAYLAAPTEEMANNATALNTLIYEAIVDITLGNSTVESYENYLAQWRAIAGSIEADADAWYQANK